MTNTRQVFIRCEAGRVHGLGHLMRCLTIAEAIAAHGATPVLVAHDKDGLVAAAAARRHLGFVQSGGPAGSAADCDILVHLVGQAQGNAVLLDSREADADYCRRVANAGPLACLDDEALRDLPCHLLINPHPWVGVDSYPAQPKRQVLAGAAANLVRPGFFRVAVPEPPVGTLRILLTMGGEDPGNVTLWILRNLTALRQHRVTVILGPAHPAPHSVMDLASDMGDAIVCITSPADMVPHILAADLALTACGTSCYELAAARVPQLGVVIEDHQMPLATAMVRTGAMRLLAVHNNLDATLAARALSPVIVDSELRRAMSQAAANVFKQPGAFEIASAILSLTC